MSGRVRRPTLRRRAARRPPGGRPDAFGQLAGRHSRELWAIALRTLGDPDDAADAVQEALVSAYRRASMFRGDAAVRTWLRRIV